MIEKIIFAYERNNFKKNNICTTSPQFHTHNLKTIDDKDSVRHKQILLFFPK